LEAAERASLLADWVADPNGVALALVASCSAFALEPAH